MLPFTASALSVHVSPPAVDIPINADQSTHLVIISRITSFSSLPPLQHDDGRSHSQCRSPILTAQTDARFAFD